MCLERGNDRVASPPDVARVQRVTREPRRRWTTVEHVAGERMTDGREMDAQLVADGHAGSRFDERPLTRRTQDPKIGTRLARAVTRDVARVHAGIHALLIFRMVG